MGYMHIDNLYMAPEILMFREVYALEKVHGTSAHIAYNVLRPNMLHFFSGGENHERFVDLFDSQALLSAFEQLGHDHVVVYGEAYGGEQQGMSETYGKDLHFIAFEVKIGKTWLAVPNAHDVVTKLGLEFVPYERIECTAENLERERDRPSRVAMLRGRGEDKVAEGIVIRPLVELCGSGGQRIIAKFKSGKFAERRSGRDAGLPSALDPEDISQRALEQRLSAKAIAAEWVTDMRLKHVLDAIYADRESGNKNKLTVKDTGAVIAATVGDIRREGRGEVNLTREAVKVIGTTTAKMFLEHLNKATRDE